MQLDSTGSISKNRRVRRIGFLGPPVRSIVKDDDGIGEDQENIESLKRDSFPGEAGDELGSKSFSFGAFPFSSLSLNGVQPGPTGSPPSAHNTPVRLPSPPKSAPHQANQHEPFGARHSGVANGFSENTGGKGRQLDSAYVTGPDRGGAPPSLTKLSSQAMSISPATSSSGEFSKSSPAGRPFSAITSAPHYDQKKVETPGLAAMHEYIALFEPKIVLVNGKPYNRLDLIGRGGSSKVYKVMNPQRKILALKRVPTRNEDSVALESYVNEIHLLQQLQSSPRIINLYDWEQTADHIVLVMECGEIDLAHLLQRHQTQRLSMNFIRLYWEQMLEAVQTIHDASIVHTDLKPANFLLVEGSLKLIDFGIAKAIGNDTTNIQREYQTGTCNYMSPESLNFVDGQQGAKTLKLGRASDVWSLGCILYQMVYGQPPFGHLPILPKLQAIVNEQYEITFPAVGQTESDVAPAKLQDTVLLQVLQSCLCRNPKLRMTIPTLLAHPFLFPEIHCAQPPPLPHTSVSHPHLPAPQPIRKLMSKSSGGISHSRSAASALASGNSSKLHQKPFKLV